MALAWELYTGQGNQQSAEKHSRAIEEQKQWKRQERAREKATIKAHLEDLRDRMIVPLSQYIPISS